MCAPARHGRCRCFIRLSTLASLSARPLQRRHRSLTGRRRVAVSRSRSAERAVGQLVPQVRSLSLARVIPIHPPITCFLRARPLSRRRRLSSRLLSGFSARRLRRMRAHAHARARARRVPLRPSSSLARALRLAACALSRLRVFARAARGEADSEGAYVGYTADMRRLYCAGAGLHYTTTYRPRRGRATVRSLEY